MMNDLTDFIKRHSRQRLSLERKLSQHKTSQYSLRKKSGRKSNQHLQISVNDRHYRSSHHPVGHFVPHKDINSLFLQGKSLYKEYKLPEACKLFLNVLQLQPNHEEALYLLGISFLNIGRTEEASKCLQRLQSTSPNYKANVYLLLSICFNKMKNTDKALHYLTIAIQKYENFFQAFCYRAKIYLSLKKYQKAEEDFSAAIAIDSKKQVALVGKADTLQNRGMYKEALKYYTMALDNQENVIVLLKRAVLLYESKMYGQALRDITRLVQIQPSTEVYFYRGMLAKIYEKEINNAILYFQQAIKCQTNEYLRIKSVQQLLKIRIEDCDFYECTSILQWAVSFNKLIGLDIWSKYVEGVVSLMKKKYLQAENSLKSAEELLHSQKQNTQHDYLYPLVKLYRAYGQFSLHKYEQAYNSLVQYCNFLETVMGKTVDDKRVEYNKLLCQGLMLCQSEFYDESLEKLKELTDMSPSKVQPHFYYIMVLLKVAFSQTPYTTDHETKDEILLAVLQMIEDRTHLHSSSSVMFFDALLKIYFNLNQQAEKSMSKSIEKGQEHLGKYFYWRGMLNSTLNNVEQALNDLSVAINIEEKPQYLLSRCRVYQLNGKTEQAYEDLQKFIELQPNQAEVSKWATIILFVNRAYEEAIRALAKVPYIENDRDLKLIAKCLSLLEGRWEDAEVEGKVMKEVTEGKDSLNIDDFIKRKEPIGFLSVEYLYFLRVVKHYSQKKYTSAIRDLQYLMFVTKDEQLFLEIKYSIMVCHLLNGDLEKGTSLFKGMLQVQERLMQIENAIKNNESVDFGDLVDHFPRKRLSERLPSHLVPNSNNLRLKISIPYPSFPNPHLELKITEEMIANQVKLEAVQGCGEAPWIRRMDGNSTVQFTNHVQQVSISLKTSAVPSQINTSRNQ